MTGAFSSPCSLSAQFSSNSSSFMAVIMTSMASWTLPWALSSSAFANAFFRRISIFKRLASSSAARALSRRS